MRRRTQKPISARINTKILYALDELCREKRAKRNRVINRAIRDYVRLLEIMTRCDMNHSDFRYDEEFQQQILSINARKDFWAWI